MAQRMRLIVEQAGEQRYLLMNECSDRVPAAAAFARSAEVGSRTR
jgi:hypothetical protein